jgi:polyisoprenyl-phosphate glycosyltransferase
MAAWYNLLKEETVPQSTVDIVIPMYNESAAIPALLERLAQVFHPAALRAEQLDAVHFIFVDDGSVDDTPLQIQRAILNGLPATLLRLSRNFGHQNAVSAGIAQSTGSATVVMDADLQDPPEEILKMVRLWRQGNDVVYGVRRKRKESLFKRTAYSTYYRLLSFLSEIDIPRDSGDFGLMDARVVRELMRLPEKLRFPRGLRAWVGFRQIGHEYERDARCAGDSKYPFNELYKLATDGIVSLSARPLKLVQLCAFLMAGFFLICLAASLLWAFKAAPERGLGLWFLGSYTLSALSGFFTLSSLFVISGYLGRMFFEIKARPSFIVMEHIDAQSLALSERTPRRSSLEHNDRVPLAN